MVLLTVFVIGTDTAAKCRYRSYMYRHCRHKRNCDIIDFDETSASREGEATAVTRATKKRQSSTELQREKEYIAQAALLVEVPRMMCGNF